MVASGRVFECLSGQSGQVEELDRVRELLLQCVFALCGPVQFAPIFFFLSGPLGPEKMAERRQWSDVVEPLACLLRSELLFQVAGGARSHEIKWPLDFCPSSAPARQEEET